MEQCEVCGNTYDKSFTIEQGGETHVFDSFECAIHLLAPMCTNCGCRIMGHGVEVEGAMFCGAHCARERGMEGVEDRI